MPQFEVQTYDPPLKVVIRARSIEDAVKRSALPEGEYVVATEADYHGWQDIFLEYQTVAKIRPHQRMKFRRD